MSTTDANSSTSTGDPPAGTSSADSAAVADARLEIRSLVAEVAQLSKSDISPTEFYEVLVSRTVNALAAVGGAIWLLRDDGVLSLEYQVNYRQTGLADDDNAQTRHGQLLRQILDQPQGAIVAPHTGAGEDAEAGNPTDHLLILAPLGGDQPEAIIEVFQRGGTGPVTQRGYLRFVLRMAEIATEYLRSHRLRQFEDRQTLWSQLNEFTQTIHQSLDIANTAYTIANEGRRLLNCDRVSLAIRQGRRCRIAAISNQDTPDKRSNVVTSLGKLAERVVATGEAVWYTGDARHLPPQVEEALDAHVDHAHCKAIGILPLIRTSDSDDEPARKRRSNDVLGAIVIEQFDQARFGEGLLHRSEMVRQHAATALGNALDHHGPLMPLLRTLGRTRLLAATHNMPKTWAVVAAIAIAVASLFFIPADFELEASGTLEPSVRRDLFAQEPGLVTEVLVQHGDLVSQEMPLVQLRSRELEMEITDITGLQMTTEEQMTSLRRARSEPRLSSEERDRLAGQLQELQGTFDSYTNQIRLLETKRDLLQLKSPIAGQVITWDVDQRLLQRPVQKGQLLMTIADPAGPWELEIKMREDRMGHISRAMADARTQGEPLRVEYILATEPGRSRVGKVVSVQSAAELRGQDGNTVLIRVAPDRSDLEDVELRPGASVTARVHAGRHSLGYVLFHDAIAVFNSQILFRL